MAFLVEGSYSNEINEFRQKQAVIIWKDWNKTNEVTYPGE